MQKRKYSSVHAHVCIEFSAQAPLSFFLLAFVVCLGGISKFQIAEEGSRRRLRPKVSQSVRDVMGSCAWEKVRLASEHKKCFSCWLFFTLLPTSPLRCQARPPRRPPSLCAPLSLLPSPSSRPLRLVRVRASYVHVDFAFSHASIPSQLPSLSRALPPRRIGASPHSLRSFACTEVASTGYKTRAMSSPGHSPRVTPARSISSLLTRTTRH